MEANNANKPFVSSCILGTHGNGGLGAVRAQPGAAFLPRRALVLSAQRASNVNTQSLWAKSLQAA